MSHNQTDKTDSGWNNQAGYIWSLIGSAVGFGNILSFSSHCYKNGGGAFLIPYTIALFILGIPLLLLEGLIGNKWKLPLVSSYGKAFGSIGKTLGWLAVIACTTIGGFYTVLTGYSVAYTYYAGTGAIPENTKSFFTEEFLKASSSLSQFGEFSIPVCLATLFVILFTWYVLSRNIKDGIEKICSFFMPLLTCIMVLFAIVVNFLPGGFEGWIYYLKPDFSKIWDATLWRDVFGQLLFSLSLGIGIVVGYSRHTGSNINIAKAMRYVALGDFFVSFISGFAIFGCISHMSTISGTPFAEILDKASTFEIGFVIFPKIINTFGAYLAPFVGSVFFFCLFIAGVTGVFSIVESVAGNVEVEFGMSRKKAVSISMVVTMVLAVFFCMGNSSQLIDAIAPMVVGINMLIGSLMLVVVFMFLNREIKENAIWQQDKMSKLSLRTVVPLLLAIILIGNLQNEIVTRNSEVMLRWSWFMIALGTSYIFARRAKQKAVALQHVA